MLAIRAILILFISFYKTGLAIPDKYWEGNWFPADPGSADTNDAVNEHVLSNIESKNYNSVDEKHGVKMGVLNQSCDNGQANLTLDWDGSPEYYTCYDKKFKRNFGISPVESCSYIPKGYYAQHYCMNKTIFYDEKIPTFGNHRPIWPKYGEYMYVPRERYLHNLEHGGIVMLYHPCANFKDVNKLKTILKHCMWKHIIAANPDLTEERPITLLSWGCRLSMNVVDTDIVKKFIKKYANKGPEQNTKQGFYTMGLIHLAKVIVDQNDSLVCPDKM